MSTRSRIGIANNDGTITSIYCHNDGYLTYNGKILAEHYTTEDQVRQLMALGDLSALGHNPVAHDQEYADTFWRGDYDVDEFMSKCISYWAWRSEYCPAQTIKAYKFKGLEEEYSYLFDDGQWFVSGSESGYEYQPLEGVLRVAVE